MSHLRLVHSAPNTSAPVHPCIEAFQRELDYLHESLRRLGAREDEIEDLSHEVFLSLHRSWPDYDPSRPIRPHVFGIAYQIVSATRTSPTRELSPPTVDSSDGTADPGPTAQWMAVLLEAGKVVPRQPETVHERASARARAALSDGRAIAPEPGLRERERGPGLRVLIPLVLASAVGATSVALALHGRGYPPPPVSAIASAPASEPSRRRAELHPAPIVAPVPVNLGQRPRPDRLPAAEKPQRSPELECLQRALVAFEGQDFDTALTALLEHARRFPRGWLSEEREALRVRSLAGAGHFDEARAAAAEFDARFPHSVLGRRLDHTSGAWD